MAEYIERDAVHELLRRLPKYAWEHPSQEESHTTVDCDDVNFGVDEIPPTDVAKVVHGRWKIKGHAIICSVCAEPYFYQATKYPKYAYCPACGAKMDGDEY